MALQFVPGNSGTENLSVISENLTGSRNTSGEKVSGDRTGTVYDADTEGNW